MLIRNPGGKCAFNDKFDIGYGTCPEDDISCRCPVDDSDDETLVKVLHMSRGRIKIWMSIPDIGLSHHPKNEISVNY